MVESLVRRPDPSAGSATGGMGFLPGNVAIGGMGLVGQSFHQAYRTGGKKKRPDHIIREDEEILELIMMGIIR